jgi:predicted PurR-regulated permease PerM
LWGVLAALLRFLPYVGAPLAGIIPVALGAAVDPGWSMTARARLAAGGVKVTCRSV